MKCKWCEKEFDDVETKHSKEWDRGDGVMYGHSSWSYTPICPHCGWDSNDTKVYLDCDGNKEDEKCLKNALSVKNIL